MAPGEDPSTWKRCAGCGVEYLAGYLCRRHQRCPVCHEADGITPKEEG